jgi:tetratricopeptide (TPR) repeat protein
MTNIIELVMIVRNSGDILKNCLQENKKFIDHWTILDTGSTDNTKEIIKSELSDIPGNLYEEPFVNFAHSRNRSLELSSKSCKYTIILDDSYILHGGQKLKQLLSKSKQSCFSISIGNYRDNFLQNDYISNRIIKSSDNLKYKYRVHEHIIVNKKNIQEITDPEIFINDVESMEHKNRSVNRHNKDIQLLLLDHKDYPNDPHVIYYLAKTYYNLERYDDALIYFRKLNELKNNIDIEYQFSYHYDTICTQFMIDNNIDNMEISLKNILQKFKNRKEIDYKLAVIYKDRGHNHFVQEILNNIILCKKPKLIHTIIEKDIYDYLIPYLYIDLNLILGNINLVIPQLKRLLEIYPNNQPLLNIKYTICDNSIYSSPIKLSNNKTIVFHTGGGQLIFKNWNPKKDSRISGSEYMAINLAQEFHKKGYRVFIIGSFEESILNIDYQCVYNGVEYIDYKYFSEFALKYEIDILVISRYTSNLVYYDNIKSVYLWVHDVLPITDESNCFQIHKEKFKNIIAISNWQKTNIVNKLNIPEERIIVSRNAIHKKRFIQSSNFEKIPFRFIYTSDPSRGLTNLINLIPQIKERYPETTLHIFVKKENIEYETLKKIEQLDYVFINGRVSQEELAIEFLKSDIFFYPTDFKETYCITALEAMCSKCLVVTVKLAALIEIVEGKGVLCDYPFRENTDELLEKLYFVLDRPKLKTHFINTAYNWGIEQTYERLVNEWIDFL